MFMIENVLTTVSDFIWGWPLVALMACAGVVMTSALGWIQIRYFKKSLNLVFHPEKKGNHDTDYITPFQAFLNTLSASLGNGSAAGMATAMACGGPGTAFWIFVIGFFGIAVRFVEVYASTYYMDENKEGVLRGGPMVYLGHVPGSDYLPTLYAFFCLLTSFVAGSAMQCNSMTMGIGHLLGVSGYGSQAVLATLLAAIILYIVYGGASRIMRFSEKIIPVKVGLFFICALALFCYHSAALGDALELIISSAFTWQAVTGAGMGYSVHTALRYGISRSVSATELGLGTAGILFGSTGSKQPFKNGIMSMASLMMSNHLVCCLLLLIFVASGVWNSGLTSTALTSAAFETLFGVYGKIIVTFLSISFGLGVLVAYAYIGRECWLFLFPRISLTWYTGIYAAMAFFGTFSTVASVWSAVDIANAGMLIMNMYALCFLLPRIVKAVRQDEKRFALKEKEYRLPDTYKVAAHTDHVGKGSIFVAIPGTKENGAKYIATALHKGATTIVLDHEARLEPHELALLANVSSYRVENTRRALAELSAHAYGYPAKKLKIIGITGTKGKTTTTYLVEHILKSAGFKTARLSTVSNALAGQEYPATLTTPQPDYIHMFLDACVQADVEWVVMEVAAQALSLYRVWGIEFDGVIFTNFSQEHGEFYANQQDYFAAKASILKQLKRGAPVILNGDDKLVTSLRSLSVNAHLSSLNDITHIGTSAAGISGYIDQLVFENSALLGAFNLHNIHMAYLLARQLHILPEVIQDAVSTFKGVPGRLNKYPLAGEVTAYIDYAHTPSSMKAVLSTLRPETQQLIVLFGAGGDRDTLKRPVMGELAVEYADHVILTTDNPRSESPEKIIEDILAGIPQAARAKVHIEYDRAVAIKYAYALAQEGAIIALLGKGPDEYQLIQDKKFHFSEREILKSL